MLGFAADWHYSLQWQQIIASHYFVLTNHQSDILDFANLGIYLSDLDLENDLWDCLQIDDKKEFVENLYESKWINMWELLESLTLVEAQKIYEHEKFQCLKALTNE